jgi:hypothetical protein
MGISSTLLGVQNELNRFSQNNMRPEDFTVVRLINYSFETLASTHKFESSVRLLKKLLNYIVLHKIYGSAVGFY